MKKREGVNVLMKKIWLIGILCLFYLTVGTAFAEQEAIVNTKSSPLGMRQNPEQNSQIVLEIAKGETVTVLGNGDWPLIEYNGQQGYVNGKYLQYIESKEVRYLQAVEDQKSNLFSKAYDAFCSLGNYADSMDRVKIMNEAKLYPMRCNNRYGLMNESNDWVVKPQWDFLGEAIYIAENKYVYKSFVGAMNGNVPQEGKWGLIDNSGEEIIPCIWDHIDDIQNRYVICSKMTNDGNRYSMYYFDGASACVIAEEYTWLDPESDGYILYERDGKWGFLCSDGSKWNDIEYTDAFSFCEGLASVQIDGKYGFIDVNGDIVLKPEWDGGGWFGCGLGLVQKDGKWGYIDKQGVWVIQPQYNMAYKFQDGYNMAIVGNDGKQWLIDKNGKQIGQTWDQIYAFHEDGTAIVERDGKYGLIDQDGNMLLKAQNTAIIHAKDSIIFCILNCQVKCNTTPKKTS